MKNILFLSLLSVVCSVFAGQEHTSLSSDGKALLVYAHLTVNRLGKTILVKAEGSAVTDELARIFGREIDMRKKNKAFFETMTTETDPVKFLNNLAVELATDKNNNLLLQARVLKAGAEKLAKKQAAAKDSQNPDDKNPKGCVIS